MPIVFAINEKSASGHQYNDKLGLSYEYPKLYRKIIQQGERFVYYRGGLTRSGARITPVYLGIGVVGVIAQSRGTPDCLTCEVGEYHSFAVPVPFKSSDGIPLEPGGTAGGLYY